MTAHGIKVLQKYIYRKAKALSGLHLHQKALDIYQNIAGYSQIEEEIQKEHKFIQNQKGHINLDEKHEDIEEFIGPLKIEMDP